MYQNYCKLLQHKKNLQMSFQSVFEKLLQFDQIYKYLSDVLEFYQNLYLKNSNCLNIYGKMLKFINCRPLIFSLLITKSPKICQKILTFFCGYFDKTFLILFIPGAFVSRGLGVFFSQIRYSSQSVIYQKDKAIPQWCSSALP